VVNHGSVDSLGEQEGVVKFEYDHDKNTLRQIFRPILELSLTSWATSSEYHFENPVKLHQQFSIGSVAKVSLHVKLQNCEVCYNLTVTYYSMY